jgi:hypothetical protein
MSGNQQRQAQSGQSRDPLDREHDLTTVDAIRHDAAEDKKTQQHDHSERAEKTEVEWRGSQIE